MTHAYVLRLLAQANPPALAVLLVVFALEKEQPSESNHLHPCQEPCAADLAEACGTCCKRASLWNR
mgnify:CR=1 FL=1